MEIAIIAHDGKKADMVQFLNKNKTILSKEKITPNAEAEVHLKNYFNHIHSNRDKHFGNARTVRQVIAEAIKNQHLRLAEMPSAERTAELLHSLALSDVKEFELTNERSSGGSLGFKIGN